MMRENTVLLDGRKVSDRRDQKGWKQTVLAGETGLARRTIQSIEKGGHPVGIETAQKVAKALGCKLGNLVLKDLSSSSLTNLITHHGVSFDAYIKDKIAGFRGRGFVCKRIKEFLKERGRSSGYLMIRGEPGIGKSALIAHLVRDRPLGNTVTAYHFNIASQAINTTTRFIANIAAQLISRFRLPYADLPKDFDVDGTFLNNVLHLAAAGLGRPDKLIIAIDALDEVQPHEKRRINPLCLPSVLPKGVYAVVTARPAYDVGIQASSLQEWTIESQSPENEEDIRLVIQDHLPRTGIQSWIRRKKICDKEFEDMMVRKSEGNFMYLRHVLPEIENGRFLKDKMAELPQGLRQYYRCHWAQMRDHDPETFEQLYQPVVCVLAAAPESVSVDQLTKWTRRQPSQIRRVLRDWQEFLDCEGGHDRAKKYRLYHAAFMDFLKEEVDPGLITSGRKIATSILGRI